MMYVKKAVRAHVRTMSPSGKAKDNHKNIECKECEVRPFCWSFPNSLNDFFNKTGHDTIKPHCLKKQHKMMTEVWKNEIQFYTKFETIQ